MLLDKNLPNLLIYQLKTYWVYYLGALISLIATHYIQSELPFLAKEMADLVLGHIEEISTLKLIFLAIGIIVFRTASRLLFFYPARILQKDLRAELLARLESSSPLRYQSQKEGQLFQCLGADMEEVRAMIGFAYLQVFNMIIALAILMPRLIHFNAQLVTGLIPLLISFLIFLVVVSTSRKFYRLTQDYQGELQNFIMESYAGKKTIKNYHSEGAFLKLFKEHSGRELENFYQAGRRIAFSVPVVPLGLGLSLVWGAIIIRSENLGPSSLILFSGFIYLLLEPLMFLSWIGVIFSRSHGAWRRIVELVYVLGCPNERELALSELNNLKTDHAMALTFWDKYLSLNVNKGQFLILVGKTGHGKTEILRQICHLIRERGEMPSYVAQEPYLYNASVEENIFLGKDPKERDLELATRLLKLMGLEELGASMREILSLEVGENGKRLSGGQAKRLCLIRSLLLCQNYLIWDDPFSSVDVIHEKEIVSALKKMPEFQGKTFILTGHRLSTVRLCDEVILLDKEEGEIERGETSQLLTTQSRTYEYFKHQMV